MNGNIKSTNIRFNLSKDLHRKAWEFLQTMDKREFKSYSNVVSLALVKFFENYYKTQNDPYLETREREELFVNQIVVAVENAMDKTLPIYLAGCVTGISKLTPQIQSFSTQSDNEEPDDEDMDWDFLGE